MIAPPELPKKITLGRVHSIETMGTVDGPGLRYVLFLQGCPLRCAYCHNPDSQEVHAGALRTVDEVVADILKYRSFLRKGGLTISGGEPLIQHEFVAEVFQRCRREGIHTALDTSGFCPVRLAKDVLDVTDLVLLDIKSFRPETFRNVTGVDVRPTLRFASELAWRSIPTWIRYVLVPGLTDNLEEIEELAFCVSNMPNVQRVEVLPFHKMGEAKYRALGKPYRLYNTSAPGPELVREVEAIFDRAGCPVAINDRS
jgi:pyruvate formate lyase activating enzyme